MPEAIDEVGEGELAVDQVLVVLADVLGQVAHQGGVDLFEVGERFLARFEDGLVPGLPALQLGDLAGALLGFSRALGEFGATIVIAGNIPGQTQTVAVAMFGYLETGRDADAGWLLVASLAICLTSVWVSNRLAEPRRHVTARAVRVRRDRA